MLWLLMWSAICTYWQVFVHGACQTGCSYSASQALTSTLLDNAAGAVAPNAQHLFFCWKPGPGQTACVINLLLTRCQVGQEIWKWYLLCVMPVWESSFCFVLAARASCFLFLFDRRETRPVRGSQRDHGEVEKTQRLL